MLDVPNSTAADLDKAKDSAEYKRAYAKLADPEWRLDNLYWIKDENAREIPFVMNAAQRAYLKNRHFRNLCLKARQLGFSTLIEILKLDNCMFMKNTRAAIVDAKISDAEKKLTMITYAYDHMPASIREQVPLKKRNTEGLAFANGSTIEIGTSARGGTMQSLHVSEFGKISVDRPDNAREIKLGSFPAVHAGNYIDVESTGHGTTGEFYDMVQRATALQAAGTPLTALDFKMHFYGWWIKPEYRINHNLVLITEEIRDYFSRISPLIKQRYGYTIDADQIAWYQKTYDDYGPDDTKSEYPSIAEEAFYNSLLGAYWKVEIARCRANMQIGHALPFDPHYRVNTSWDIGEDCTAIIWHQTDGLRHRIIDYWEEVGSSLQRACAVIEEKRLARGFVYDQHFGPHDIENKDWGNKAEKRIDTARDLGVDFTVVPRVQNKADSIEAARRLLAMTWIDQQHCSLFVERIENYRRRWNKSLMVFMPDPVHDMPSHGSDAYQGLAMGLDKDKDQPQGERRPKRERKGAWAS